MIYSSFGEEVEILGWSKKDQDLVWVRYPDGIKQEYNRHFLRADNGSNEIAKAIESLGDKSC